MVDNLFNDLGFKDLACFSGVVLEQGERVLWLYEQPDDPLKPVICDDERPCFLIGDFVEPLALQTGQVPKEHFSYEKLGSTCLLAVIEPLTGRR